MALKDKFKEIKTFIGSNDEEDVIDNSEQAAKETDKMTKNRIILIEPEDYSKTEQAAELVKSGHSVILNLNMLNEKSAQRMIDYLGGVVYALDGTIKSIGLKIILIAPNCTEVDGEIVNSSDV